MCGVSFFRREKVESFVELFNAPKACISFVSCSTTSHNTLPQGRSRALFIVMKLGFLLAGALGAVAASAGDVPGTTLDERAAIVRPQYCAIVGGATTVNCRTGPGTRHSVRKALHKGTVHPFWCVVSAQCVTINGRVNWCVLQQPSPLNSSLTPTKRLAFYQRLQLLRQRPLH
jgi:hypothetical protein